MPPSVLDLVVRVVTRVCVCVAGRLGLPRTATARDITLAYRKLARVHHPDKGGEEENFKAIVQAYDTLKCPNTRAAYDAQGHAADLGESMHGDYDPAWEDDIIDDSELDEDVGATRQEHLRREISGENAGARQPVRREPMLSEDAQRQADELNRADMRAEDEACRRNGGSSEDDLELSSSDEEQAQQGGAGEQGEQGDA